jgi:hypothetical protein
MFSRMFCGRCARFGNGQLDDGHVRMEDSPIIQLDTCNMGKRHYSFFVIFDNIL